MSQARQEYYRKDIFNSELTRSMSTKFVANLRSKGREWIKHLKVSLVTCDSLIQRKDHAPKLTGLNEAKLRCLKVITNVVEANLKCLSREMLGDLVCHQRNRVVSPSCFLKLLYPEKELPGETSRFLPHPVFTNDNQLNTFFQNTPWNLYGADDAAKDSTPRVCLSSWSFSSFGRAL